MVIMLMELRATIVHAITKTANARKAVIAPVITRTASVRKAVSVHDITIRTVSSVRAVIARRVSSVRVLNAMPVCIASANVRSTVSSMKTRQNLFA